MCRSAHADAAARWFELSNLRVRRVERMPAAMGAYGPSTGRPTSIARRWVRFGVLRRGFSTGSRPSDPPVAGRGSRGSFAHLAF